MRRLLGHGVRLLLLAIGTGVLVLLVRAAGWEATRAELSRLGAGLLLYLLPSLGVQVFEALGWWLSFGEPPRASFTRLLLVRIAGESLNNTLPSAYLGGEPFKAMLLARAGVSGMEALASVIVAKTALTVAQIVSVLLGAGLALAARAGDKNLAVLVVGSVVCSGLAAWAVWGAYVGQRQGLGKILARVIERTGVARGWLERRREVLDRLDAALTGFYARRKGRFWLATGACLLGWLLEAAEVVLYAHLLGLPLSLAGALAIGLLISVAKAAGLLIPGSLGIQEGGVVVLFLAFGLSMEQAVAFSLVRRARELLWIGAGFGLLALLGVTPGRVAAGLAAEGAEPSRPAAEPAHGK